MHVNIYPKRDPLAMIFIFIFTIKIIFLTNGTFCPPIDDIFDIRKRKLLKKLRIQQTLHSK